ncbi:MAG TPA: VWA domain-containing protein, partial [Chthoniobacteraceae bacterium]|nr:VWA domain-containing protein [Chthoniobacteraceae bacterium]
MNWLFPGFLAGGLMVGLPIVLHLLRNKPKKIIPFPTLRFLGESAIRDTRKHWLRRWITLLLRMAFIALLAAAFARPFWKSGNADSQSVTVIAIDNSMSMQARGRWEPLRKWALQYLADLQPGDRAGLLLMNPEPTWLVPVTGDLDRVRSTLEQLQPGYETTRYAGALRVAGDALAANPGRTKTLVWMADEQRLGWLGASFDQHLAPGIKIDFPDMPPLVKHQAAIASLAWVSGTDKPAIDADVRLYTPETESRRITVRVAGTGGAVVAQQQMDLRRSGENRIRLPLNIPPDTQPAGYCVSLESLSPADADDLAADDSAWIVATQSAGMPVIFEPAKSGADYLAHALQSTRKLNGGALEPLPLPAADWPADEVAIVRSGDAFTGAQGTRLDHFVDAGGVLWIFADGSDAQAKWLQARGIRVAARERADGDTEPWHLRDWDPDHPLLAPFAGEGLLPLMDIEFQQGFNLDGDGLDPVAKWPDGATAIAEWVSGGHRIFLCGFAPEREATDWMVRPTFVPLVHQAVRWLSAYSSVHADLRIGDTIAAPAPGGKWSALDTPQTVTDNNVLQAGAGGNLRPGVPGIYQYTTVAKSYCFAVNVPSEESDLTPWPDPGQLASLQSSGTVPDASAKQPGLVTVSDAAAESQQRLWWWVLAACCLIMLG